MRYPVESFTPEEQKLLAPHFTNLDRPVFALVNLPETVKGALFARYSRYQGTLRRLFLDEFAADVPDGGRPFEGEEGERAAGLYERVFIGYGDDSIAQVGGAHIACEWVSNILTKVLQRGRLAAYLEQSTRYIPYDSPMDRARRPGRWRYYRDDELGAEFVAAMDELFEIYSAASRRSRQWAGGALAARRRARGGLAALDQGQGARPAARPAARRDAEPRRHLRLRPGLRAAAAADAAPRRCPRRATSRAMMLTELKKVIPSFVARVERPDRGGEWISYLERAPRGDRALGRPPRPRPPRRARRALGRAGPRRRQRGGPARRVAVRERRRLGGRDPRAGSTRSTATSAQQLLAELVGERANRRHRPGRGWEAVRYRFEIVSDYGGFRDLQRHRMLTCQWQRLGPDLGAGIPEEVGEAGVGERVRARARALAGASSSASRRPGLAEAAPYALCLGYRIRYVLDLNAREAMHLIELRSGREGHPTYRAVAQAMHEQIAAVHPRVAAAMTHVDTSSEPRLERIMSEIRTHRKQIAAAQAG